MGQRLGIASALLADPETLILDEPVNGLDPEGIRWIRDLLKDLAAEGRTVFVSSHLMSEMALTAEHLIVVGRGRLMADMPMAEFIAGASSGRVRVSSPHASRLHQLLAEGGSEVGPVEPGSGADAASFTVSGLQRSAVGDLAAAHGITLHELTSEAASLEHAFMELTTDDVEFRAPALSSAPPELAAPVATGRRN